jgi:hypothetical protein
MGGRRVAIGRVLPWCLLVALVACTGAPEPAGSPPPPPAPPPGSIVAFTQDVQTPPLVAFDVRGSTVRPLGDAARDPAASAAVLEGDDLLAIVVSSAGRASIVRVGGSTAPAAVGPELEGSREASYRSVSIAGDLALVADCSNVSILDTAAPNSWRSVGRGCWAALAPDGDGLVYSPNGRTVVRTGPGGAPTRVLFDVEKAIDLGTDQPPVLFGAPAWGEAGIAFTAIAGDQAGVFLRRPDGEIVQLLQEKLLKTARPPILVWRPGGAVLAMMDDLGTGGVLRTFDPIGGVSRVVALDALAFDGLVWSSDGASLATLTSAGAVLVVGTDDVWRTRVETTWNAILGWLP